MKKKKASTHFREENFYPNVSSLENWIRHAFIEKEILFHSTKANSVKHLIEALGYYFILPGEKLLINSPCKIDGRFRNLPILGFYTNHSEGIELAEVKHVFRATQSRGMPAWWRTTLDWHVQSFTMIESIRFYAQPAKEDK